MSGELRIILLVLGLVLLLVIYVKTRIDSKKKTVGGKRGGVPTIELSAMPGSIGANDNRRTSIADDHAAGTDAPHINTDEPVADADTDADTPPQMHDPAQETRTEMPTDTTDATGTTDIGGAAATKLQTTAKTTGQTTAETEAETTGEPGGLRGMWDATLRKLFQNDQKIEDEDESEPGEILILHIRAPSDREFYGREVLFAADKVGLMRGGKDKNEGAFEKVLVKENGERHVQFYVADMFNPGVFEWDTLDDRRVRGLSLCTVISDSNANEAVDIFDDMVVCARNMAAMLEGATLLDDKRSTLTNQTISHMREHLREKATKSHILRE